MASSDVIVVNVFMIISIVMVALTVWIRQTKEIVVSYACGSINNNQNEVTIFIM